MKNRQQITPELLQQIAALLGNGWRYNAVMTTGPKYRGYYLSNGEGLIINVRSAYGEHLPQWALEYPHPTHKHLQKFCSIGCSLAKSKSAIVADLKARLLSRTGEAFSQWQALIESEGKKLQAQNLDDIIIQSLRRVLRLRGFHDRSYCKSYCIENDNESCIAKLHKWSEKGDSFRLDIDDLTAEKVIKIMQIVNE